MGFKYRDQFSDVFPELPVASEISERLCRRGLLSQDELVVMEDAVDLAELEGPSPEASLVSVPCEDETSKTISAEEPSCGSANTQSPSGLAAFADLLQWAEKATNAQASMLTDRQGLLIASSGLMLTDEMAQTYGARLAVMLDQIDHFAEDESEDKLLCIRIGSFWLTATQLRLSEEQPLLLSVIGEQPVQFANFNELACERIRSTSRLG